MVVENLDNKRNTIQIPKIIKPLITEGEEYFIIYEHSSFSKSLKLVYIEK